MKEFSSQYINSNYLNNSQFSLFRKKKVSVQEQYLLLLQILPKFWSRFQLIGFESTQRHKCFKGARCLWYCSMK